MGRGQASVYPQFASLERHIKHEIREGMRDNTLMAQDAHGLRAQLRQIHAEEMREYQAHGPDLPPRDQARIGGELQQLAQSLDQRHRQQ
jgi:hypothetical protein